MLASQMPVNPFKHKALSLIDRRIFIEFMHTLKGAHQFKPQPNQFSRTETGFEFGPVPVGNPNENPNFNQVVPVLVQGNALKRLKTLGRAVSVIEMAPPFQLVSAAGSLLDPPLKPGMGAFVFVPPN